MTREEILNEIDDTLAFFRSAKVKVGETLTHARNVVAKKGSEEAYNKGLEDAWELASKISHYTSYSLLDRFEAVEAMCVFDEYTYQEALAKLEAYEKANEIKVGDVVEYCTDNEKAVVLAIEGRELKTLTESTKCEMWFRENVKKTGKHIDIQSILEQIKE